MLDFLQSLARADFLPHGWCYRWDPGLIWLHVASDLMIALAYFFIPFSLVYVVRRRGDLVYPWMFWLFGAFILACGTTHLMSVFVVWQPWYRLDGVVKLVTALVSVPTAILLLRISPAVIALPSPEQLRAANRQLESEVAVRKAAEQEVRRLNSELEQRVAERTKELEVASQRLHAILDNAPLLVYLKDPEDRLLFVNRQFEVAFGLSREQLEGRPVAELFPAEDAAKFRAADAEVWQEKKALQCEEEAASDGQVHTYISVKYPLFDAYGKPWALCGMSTDITERKRAEQALQRYNEELEQFAFAAAHDLQEPLRMVKSYAQLLARRYSGQLDAAANDFLGYITGGVDRMQRLVGGLQHWSELNREPDRHRPSDAAAVLRSTLRDMERLLEESGATVEFSELPTVRIDSSRLGQVFQNLIGNAIKYRSAEAPRISITAVPVGREWEFRVADNGMGFRMDYAEQIFGVFRRLHGQEIAGTGIGLAIVKKIIDSAGGRIWAESEPDKGATFFFRLRGA